MPMPELMPDRLYCLHDPLIRASLAMARLRRTDG